MRRAILTAALLVLGLTTSAHAFHVGASYVNTDSEFDTAVENFDPDDSGYKAYAGFDFFFDFLDLELAFRDLGTHTQIRGASSVDVDIEVYDASLRAALPLGKRFSVFARAGYANISVDGSFDLDGVLSSLDDDSWEAFYGAGVDIRFGDHLGVRAEWEEFDVDDSLNSLSAGVFLDF